MAKGSPIATRLRDLVGEVVLEEDDQQAVATVTLRCPRCGGTRFVVHLRYEQVHTGADAGKTLPFSPVWVACGACRYFSLVFDSRADGLNGLNSLRPIRIPDSPVKAWESAREATYGVQVVVQYDKAVADFDDDGNLVPDAYHWLSVVAEWSDGSSDDVIDFETA